MIPRGSMFYLQNERISAAAVDTLFNDLKRTYVDGLTINKNDGDELWEWLAKERGRHRGKGKTSDHYAFSKKMATIYAAYYLPVNVLKVPLILEELYILGHLGALGFESSESTIPWADIGCGPGTVGWGLKWWVSARAQIDHKAMPFRYYGFDQSKQFVSLGEPVGASLLKGSVLDTIKTQRARVVSFSNSVDEVFSDAVSKAVFFRELLDYFERLPEALNQPVPLLCLVEPASKVASRDLLELRKTLIEQGWRILTPCFSNRQCGALESKVDDWCYAEVEFDYPSWFNAMAENMDLTKSAINFSYLVCVPEKSIRQRELQKHFEASACWSRMVSQRMVQKGFMQSYWCTDCGRMKARVLDSKKDAVSQSARSSFYRGALVQELVTNEKSDVVALSAVSDAAMSTPLRTSIFCG